MTMDTEWRGKADLVYAQLRNDIETGALAPGRTLPEVELVEYTGASRTPVREAVRRLATEGLIDLEPRRAPTVSRISLRSARALFDFRRLLEPAAIRQVADHVETDRALQEALINLLEQFEAMRNMDYSPDFARLFTQATAEFDHLLAAHTPNEYLSRTITDLRPHSARLRHIAHSDPTRLQESTMEHIGMCQSVLAGRGDDAAQALLEHLNHVSDAIFRQLLNVNADLLVS